MSSHFTPGHSARSGLEAALLAEAGYECAETMLEGEKGYANVFSENPQFHVSTEDLGTRFEAVSVSYKPYPCGFVIHPVIDACLALSTEDGVTPAQIARLDLTCNPMLTALTDRVHPTNRRNALVSFQHWAAVALAEGAAGIPQGGDDRLTDKVIAALRTRITTTCDTRIGREAVIARITLNDGRTIEHYVRDCVGSIGRPMTDNELSVKFQSQAQTLLPEVAADNLMARCWDIAAVDNVGDIAPTLVVA
jgi:2-methylcitrate dehydratase PrpD